MGSGKIFGIGHSKTGTFSLATALQTLGFSTVHNPNDLRQIEHCDAATDASVTAIFEDLDQSYPGSKFIYTVRELEPWLESWRRHWLKRKCTRSQFILMIREQLLGTLDYDPASYARAYERVDRRIRRYFRKREDDLLVIDVCGGGLGWKPMCDFLDVPIPETPFPWSNRTTTTEQVLARSIEIFGGIDETACATGVSAEYLMMISRERPPNEPLTWDDGGFSDRIIAALVSRLNGIGETAGMLAARPECIAVAVAHWQDRQRQFGSPTDASG